MPFLRQNPRSSKQDLPCRKMLEKKFKKFSFFFNFSLDFIGPPAKMTELLGEEGEPGLRLSSLYFPFLPQGKNLFKHPTTSQED
jgi:hypothetical protein